jgi:hypothetical protein
MGKKCALPLDRGSQTAGQGRQQALNGFSQHLADREPSGVLQAARHETPALFAALHSQMTSANTKATRLGAVIGRAQSQLNLEIVQE